MQLADNDISQIVSTICQSILGIADATPVEPQKPASGMIAACVQITGGWQGAVVLACPQPLAAKAAATMFGLEASACTDTDMQDAIAELTNMIGGNFKGLLALDEPCQLSLPAVVAGADYVARVPGSRPIHHVAVAAEGHVLQVLIVEKSPVARAA